MSKMKTNSSYNPLPRAIQLVGLSKRWRSVILAIGSVVTTLLTIMAFGYFIYACDEYFDNGCYQRVYDGTYTVWRDNGTELA